jgi:hypothetical protein
LEFHLPYYAWRRKQPTVDFDDEDEEEEFDGKPTRQTEEVIPLKLKGHDFDPIQDDDHSRDYIHQAQISVMITGADNWFWTGYCFVDTYFKAADHSESVEHYSRQRPEMDPFSCGKDDANLPFWLPRQYFLRTLSSRMEQVKQEWKNTVSQLFQLIDPVV